MPKLFEEQTSKSFTFVSANGHIITNKCNNCGQEFKWDGTKRPPLICPSCGNK